METTVLWWRRDLRLADHPALWRAADEGRVVPLFVLDPRLLASAGTPRVAFLLGCLRDLADRVPLVVRTGSPSDVVPGVAMAAGARRVHVSSDHGPYGRRRDREVVAALARQGVELVAEGSPYVQTPGSVTKADGGAYRVFSPYYRAWSSRMAMPPLSVPDVRWHGGLPGEGLPQGPPPGAALPVPGEDAALGRLEQFLASALDDYPTQRDRPAVDGTTRLSAYLKYGCLHPRQVLARLPAGAAAEKLRQEVAWRDFYADVLWHRPDSAWQSLQPAMAAMEVDSGPDADDRFRAWAEGRTGVPIVDAGMRQLLGEAWVHNRVRMIVASFLVKDLHLPWQRGARHFLAHLVDGDLASNNHGWQWVAGAGTDPAPYFRVFNPVRQGRLFDPDGEYVRRWVPELRDIAGAEVHEPWRLGLTAPAGYAAPIVDHAAERAEALRRYAAVQR